jgi:tetratricopeptide (TPR) repeat protein
VAEGIAQLRQGFAAWRAVGMGLAWLWWLALLAEVCGQAGQLDEGLRALEEALEAVQRNDEHHYEAEVYRLKGELLLQQSAAQQGEAEAHFHQALGVARQRQQQGKLAEAHQLLAEVYGWFTEGFDTPDLQEAKVLLEELRA